MRETPACDRLTGNLVPDDTYCENVRFGADPVSFAVVMRVIGAGIGLHMGRAQARAHVLKLLQQVATRAAGNVTTKLNVAAARNIGSDNATEVVTRHQHAPVRRTARPRGGRSSPRD